MSQAASGQGGRREAPTQARYEWKGEERKGLRARASERAGERARAPYTAVKRENKCLLSLSISLLLFSSLPASLSPSIVVVDADARRNRSSA